MLIDPPQHAFPFLYRGQTVQLDWHLHAIDIPAAWQALDAAGSDALAAVTVGHIDTGYTEHPALGFGTPAGTWIDWAAGRNFLFTDPPSPGPFPSPDDGEGGSDVPEYPGPRDNLTGSSAGHGTRTMSTLTGLWAPTDPSLPWPFFGAAPGVRVMPFRITNSLLVDRVQAQLAAAIEAAVAAACQVISISLGAIRPDRQVAAALDDAYLRGVIVCAAAGNRIGEVVYPGRFNRTITVGGATTSDGTSLAPWSGASRGIQVDVSGPADRIRRATTEGRAGAERFLIANAGRGTSFATALCAGTAALWLACRGSQLEAAYGADRWARVAAFKRLLKQTAVTPAQWPTAEYGVGVFQAGATLAAELPALGDLHREAPAWDPFDAEA